MGCDISFEEKLEFESVEDNNPSTFANIRRTSYQSFSVHLEKVRKLCQERDFKLAQKIGDKLFSKHAILQAIEVYQIIIESDRTYGLQNLDGYGNTEMAMSFYLHNVWNFYDKQKNNNKSVYDSLSLCYMILTISERQFSSQLSKGFQWYKRMIQKDLNNVGLLIGFGNMLCNTDKCSEGVQYYDKAYSVYSQFSNAQILKAVTYQFISPTNKIKSNDIAQKVLRETKNNQYCQLIVAINIEKVDERIASLESLYKKYPNYHRIAIEIGSDYLQFKKDTKNARFWYEKTIISDRLFYKGFNNIAICYRDDQDYQNAFKNYFKCLSINKLFQASYLGLKYLFSKLNYKIEDIEKETNNYTDVSKDWFWLRLGEQVEKKSDLDKAIQFYKKSVQINPKFHFGFEALGKVYQTKQMTKQSIECLKKCIEMSPDYYMGYFWLAYSYSTGGYQEQALKLYEKVVEINPRYDYAYNNIGNAYFHKDDMEKAEYYYERSAFYNDQNAFTQTCLGVIYMKQSKFEESYKAFTKAKQLIEREKQKQNPQHVQFIENTLKQVDIDGNKWKVFLKSGSVSQEQKQHLQSLKKEFSNKLKSHQKVNQDIKMPLERVMHPEVMEICKIIYENKFRLHAMKEAFQHVIPLYCDVDEDYFHIIPLYIVQYFLLSVYELKRFIQEVEEQVKGAMTQLASMVAEKQKQVNERAEKQIPANAVSEPKNIKIQLKQCRPLNKQVNLFKDVAYFKNCLELYAQIQKVNNAAKPFFNDFALLVQQVRQKAKGIPGGISMKIPSKSQDQFKVIMRIMEKMFKKEINEQRTRKIIFNIQAKIVNANYGNINEIVSEIIASWTMHIDKILIERRNNGVETQCFISDLIRAKCTFNTVEDLINAVKVADTYCKVKGYDIVEVDNRLNKPQTKDVVLKIKIGEAVCEFQLAIPQSAKLFHLDHCVYEILRSPLGCVFGSYLFISKSVKYPLVKNCQDMFQQLSKSKDMMDKINRMYPQYVMNALTKEWKMNKG